MSASAATAMNSDLCLLSQRTVAMSCSVRDDEPDYRSPCRRPLPNRTSRLNYQRRDAESERVQHEELSVPGERQRSDKQHHRHDRDRQPLPTHREPDD